MKVFIVKYSWSGRFQTYEDVIFVVVAERADKAMGMAAQENEKLSAEPQYWSAEEVDTSKENVNLCYQQES